MHNKMYSLQAELQEKDIPDCISLIPQELRDGSIEKQLKDIYKSILPEISKKEELFPILHSFTNLPQECDINEIEALLKDNKPITSSFFDIESRIEEELMGDFKTASNKPVKDNTKDTKSINNYINKDNKEIDQESNLETYIIERIQNEILENVTNVTWEDIVGLDNVKKIINEIVMWPMLRPDLFKGLRGPPKGLMLFGPPGTGKTMIGKCIASQCKATFFSISASSLTSKWAGEGEKMVRALFYLGRKMQPSVIFIDEIDSLLSQRTENENEGSRRIKTEFLVQFDGTSTDANDKILIVGATNRPQEIDEAARRRLVKRVYVGLPDEQARIQMIKNLVNEFSTKLSDDDYNYIATLTEGYSGSDMFNLCREASLEPLREMKDISDFNINSTREIELNDFKKAVTQIKKSVSHKDLDSYVEWNDMYGSF